jgi:hypothetical protein
MDLPRRVRRQVPGTTPAIPRDYRRALLEFKSPWPKATAALAEPRQEIPNIRNANLAAWTRQNVSNTGRIEKKFHRPSDSFVALHAAMARNERYI